MSLGGGEPGLRPWSGLTSTAAISLARASITRSDAGLMSLSASTSLVNRSLPAPGCWAGAERSERRTRPGQVQPTTVVV